MSDLANVEFHWMCQQGFKSRFYVEIKEQRVCSISEPIINLGDAILEKLKFTPISSFKEAMDIMKKAGNPRPFWAFVRKSGDKRYIEIS